MYPSILIIDKKKTTKDKGYHRHSPSHHNQTKKFENIHGILPNSNSEIHKNIMEGEQPGQEDKSFQQEEVNNIVKEVSPVAPKKLSNRGRGVREWVDSKHAKETIERYDIRYTIYGYKRNDYTGYVFLQSPTLSPPQKTREREKGLHSACSQRSEFLFSWISRLKVGLLFVSSRAGHILVMNRFIHRC